MAETANPLRPDVYVGVLRICAVGRDLFTAKLTRLSIGSMVGVDWKSFGAVVPLSQAGPLALSTSSGHAGTEVGFAGRGRDNKEQIADNASQSRRWAIAKDGC